MTTRNREALVGGLLSSAAGAFLLLTFRKHPPEFQPSYFVIGFGMLICGLGMVICTCLQGGNKK